MTIYDFEYYHIDSGMQKVEIYEINKCETIYTGILRDACDEYGDCEVCTYEVDNDVMTFNIDIAEALELLEAWNKNN